MKQVFPSSPAMLDKPMRGVPEAKYPWKDVNVGESFPVDANDIKLTSLRPFATRMGKKLGKKFRVVDHKNGMYEVGCIPMTEQQVLDSSKSVPEVLDKISNINIRFPVNKE